MRSEHNNKTFSPNAFVKLREAESGHFWFDVRRRWIYDKLNRFCPPPATLLEIGCGTGNVSSFLSKKGYEVTGCDFFAEALDIAWSGFKVSQCSADNLPFDSGLFDITGLFDVLEHFEDDIMILKESIRVTKNGGFVFITVPARKELWSYVDVISYHKRRYTKKDIDILFEKCGLKIILNQYMFMSLYLPMKIMRGKQNNKNLLYVNPFINFISKNIFNLERVFSKILHLPIGTSIIAVGKITEK